MYKLGVGVRAVIARSFAFIYGRNQPSLGLLGVTITDEEFHKLAQDGADITLDIPNRSVTVGSSADNSGKTFPFQLSEMEYNLTINNGVAESYRRFGKGIWETFTGKGLGLKGREGGDREKDVERDIVRAAIEGGGEKGSRNEKLDW